MAQAFEMLVLVCGAGILFTIRGFGAWAGPLCLDWSLLVSPLWVGWSWCLLGWSHWLLAFFFPQVFFVWWLVLPALVGSRIGLLWVGLSVVS